MHIIKVLEYIGILVLSLYAIIRICRWVTDTRLLHSVTSRHRGTKGERRLIIKLLKFGMPSKFLFHDLYVEHRHEGYFSQIDAVAVTNSGIIVFEAKDHKGWIFGNGNYKYWTQVIAFGQRKFKIYNPILQNEGHIIALKQFLGNKAEVPYYSVVVFCSNPTIKEMSNIPQNTYICTLLSLPSVLSKILNSGTRAYYEDKTGSLNLLEYAVQSGVDARIVAKHIENLRSVLN